MKRAAYLIFALAFVLTLFLAARITHAQSVPTIISHQGRLLNSSNQPVTSNVSVVFAIYDAASAGNQVWTETQSITPDSLGFYDTFLGGSTALPSTLPNPSYLQIQVQGETLTPRLQFGSVPFAQIAGNGVPSGATIITDSQTSPAGFSSAGILNTGAVWHTKIPMPTARIQLGATVVNNKIYAIGGFGNNFLATVEEYNPVTNTWSTKAPMPTSRLALGVVAVNNKIYAIGGLGGTGFLATVEEYNPATDTWTTKSNMPTAREAIGLDVVNDKIYAIGGNNGSSLTTVEEYNPATDTWTTKANMPSGRAFFASSVVNNKIYVIGGSGGLTDNMEYDPGADTWASKANMLTARNFMAGAAVNNKVYVIGGYNGSVPLNVVEEYNPSTNSWLTLDNMPTARHRLAAAVVNGKIYAIGGYGAGNLATNEEYLPPSIFYLHKKD